MKNEMEIFVKENTWLGKSLINHGWGNGHVIISKGHKLHGVHYDNIDVNVHGGLTFSENAKDLNWPEIPESLKDGWVVGFDTAHYKDTSEKWPKDSVLAETYRLKEQLLKL
jgi:hypothetical protein